MTNSAGYPAQDDEGGLAVSKILLTVPEAAAALAISRSKLYELLAAGSIGSVRINGSRRPVDRLAVIPVASGVLCARSGAPDRHFADGQDSSHIYRPERGSGVQWTSDLVTNPGLGPSEERSRWTLSIIRCLMKPSLDVAEDC